MKIKDVKFLKSGTEPKHFPAYNHPEFAFIGRSNVGKSSLINMLTGRKSLVKTGSKPGMTRLVNFFLMNDKISIVDLPGYGYASVPISLKKKFMPMIKKYITNRNNLKLIFLLVDIRRDPGDFEIEMINFLTENKIPIAITATKSDKLTKNKMMQQKSAIAKKLNIDKDWIYITSSQNKLGRKEILSVISEYSV